MHDPAKRISQSSEACYLRLFRKNVATLMLLDPIAIATLIVPQTTVPGGVLLLVKFSDDGRDLLRALAMQRAWKSKELTELGSTEAGVFPILFVSIAPSLPQRPQVSRR